ncbi:hypothetical protein ACFV98_30540 [Streptomyces violascens]|uniref:hypothetical protein n=1 Tax=Streptomyces violascens TaxID=67381 RepID=UPI003668EC20
MTGFRGAAMAPWPEGIERREAATRQRIEEVRARMGLAGVDIDAVYSGRPRTRRPQRAAGCSTGSRSARASWSVSGIRSRSIPDAAHEALGILGPR